MGLANSQDFQSALKEGTLTRIHSKEQTLEDVFIVLIAMGGRIDFMLLSPGVFLGAVVFNLIGLTVASYARSVNHYMLIVTVPAVFLSMPPILTAFGITHRLLEIFPGTHYGTYWIGKLLIDGVSFLSFVLGLISCFLWIAFFTRRFLKRV